MAARSLSERQTGGPEVADSHAPQARGLGYGATGPMVNRCAARAPCHGLLSSHKAGGAAAPQTLAKRGGGAARSAA